MNLKTLISIKFVIYIVMVLCFIYFTRNITNCYNKLENQNKLLIEQKEYYEEILDLEEKDKQGKKELYGLIKVANAKLELDSKKSTINLNAKIWILIIMPIFFCNVFNYLNTKIEKLESQETESEREKFL
jgi:hypothetical protein